MILTWADAHQRLAVLGEAVRLQPAYPEAHYNLGGALAAAGRRDAAAAHYRRALAQRPDWVLLSAMSDWRWLLDRADTPWYPTMRLFRQERLGKWDDVIGRVAAELGRLAGSGG